MASQRIVRTICDMDHDPAGPPVDGMPVTITTPDGTWSVDLCPDHGAVLLPLVAAAPVHVKARRSRVAT